MRRTVGLIGRALLAVPSLVLIGLFRLWQLLVSPTYGQTCRFYPSCSAYGVEAVREHGAVRGLGLTVWRVLRCNPWNLGGVDHVPPSGRRSRRPQTPLQPPRPTDEPAPLGRRAA